MSISRFRYDCVFGLNKYLGIPDTMYVANLETKEEKKELGKLDLSKIITVDFPDNRYFRKITNKYQICLHHTVSGQGVDGDISWWIKNTQRIATSVIVNWDGNVYQLFSSKYWAHHLGVTNNVLISNGVKNITNKKLNQNSIGIEIDSWGGLIKCNRQWYPAKWDDKIRQNVPNLKVKPIPSSNVVVFPNGYRGFYGFEKYTDEQIETVRKLLIYWNKIYDIPLKYNEDMWDVSKKALSGDAGIWSHTSYRPDKSDCYPDDRLINMLKSLSK